VISTILYDAIDVNNSGLISKEELRHFLGSSTMHIDGKQQLTGAPEILNDKEFHQIWNQVDTDGDGWVDRQEFLTLYIYFHTNIPDWVKEIQDTKNQAKMDSIMVSQYEVTARVASAAKALEEAQRSVARGISGSERQRLMAEQELTALQAEQEAVRIQVADEKIKLELSVQARAVKLKEHLAKKRQIKQAMKDEEHSEGVAYEADIALEKRTAKAHWITSVCTKTARHPENVDFEDWAYVPKDLSHGNGSQLATYLCYKRESGKAPITGLWTTTCASSPPPGFVKLQEDLNTGTGGSAVHLCYTQDAEIPAEFGYRAAPITDIQAICTKVMRGVQYREQAPPGYITLPQDLNAGAGSQSDHREGRIPQIHLCFTQDSS